jgi:hypothetical protein
MPDPPTSLGEFISPTKFAEFSGLSLVTVRRYVADRRLPSIQPGGRRCRVLIPLSALDPFFLATNAKRGRQHSLPDPSASVTPLPMAKELPGPAPRWRAHSQS